MFNPAYVARWVLAVKELGTGGIKELLKKNGRKKLLGSYPISEVDIDWFLGVNDFIHKCDIISQYTMSQVLKMVTSRL